MTCENIRERCDNLNRRMRRRGLPVRYFAQQRYGYTAVDRYRCVSDGSGERCEMVDGPIVAGTKNEVGQFLHAMMVALDDVEAFGHD
jgi:hypothetical protein